MVWRLRRSAEAMRAVERREESDRRVRALIEHAPDVVVLLDRQTRKVTFASPSLARVLGHEPSVFADRPVGELIHPDDRKAATRAFERALTGSSTSVGATCRIQHADGTWRHFELSISSPTDEPDLDGIVVNARDVTDRVELQRSLSHQASHDPLTGLANRSAFVELLHDASERRVSEPLALVFLDLDGFKEINDSLGHAAGDEVLMTIAARLVTLTRLRDHVARLGGDEFAIAVEGDDPLPLASRMIEVIGQPIDLATGPVVVGASIGVAIVDDDVTVEDLLRRADVAMYDAKARGQEPGRASTSPTCTTRSSNDWPCGRPSTRVWPTRRVPARLPARVRPARRSSLLGYEALIRWHKRRRHHRSAERLHPGRRSERADRRHRTMGPACCGRPNWPSGSREFDGTRHLTMAVNVSAQPARGRRTSSRRSPRSCSGPSVPACSLTLELTETTLIKDVALASQRLGELHDIGVMIAIDDYGSGHASIGYLREFPVDIVKIDGSFVAALDDSRRHRGRGLPPVDHRSRQGPRRSRRSPRGSSIPTSWSGLRSARVPASARAITWLAHSTRTAAECVPGRTNGPGEVRSVDSGDRCASAAS